MNKAYPSRINWENYSSTATPLGATNLNKMDSALYTIDGRVCDMDVTKAKQSDLLECLKNVDYNTTSGIFTFTFQNGSVKTVDLNVEKIPVSFSMSATGVITMKTSDGTEYTADVGSLIKTYTFNDGNIVDFTVTTDTNGNKTVTADIKNGSITGAKLQPNYLADITAQATTAQNAATAASTSESKVKTSETNAKASETNASNSAISALSSSGSAKTSETNAKTSETNASRSETNAKTSENKAKTSETNAKSSEDNAFSYKNQAEASKTAAATSELNASTSATTSSEKALVSEGYSSGTQNGVPVDSSSPYYQNNAKYYKDQAQSSAFAQSDWNESVTTKSAYILNKPFKTIGANLSVDPDGVLSADAQSITVDSELSDTSENPVQNKVIKSAIDSKADSSSIPTKTSDLTNDSDFVVDANYVHIDVDNALSDTSENPVQNKIIKAAIDAATPSDYETVKSQVTTNKNDITSIKSDLSEYVSDGYLGKNFIESIEQGAYTESGDKQTSSTRCRVENKIPCAKGDKFVFSSELSSAQIYVRVYDASGTLLDHFDWVTNFTVVSNDASYFLVMIRKSDNSNITPTELSKAQIEYGTVATDYVPYAPSNFEITSIKKGLSNRNLLDNPWFTINQRGQSSYVPTSVSYTFDRWIAQKIADVSDAYLTQNDNGILVSGIDSLGQKFDTQLVKNLYGKTITISILCDVLTSGNGFFGLKSDSEWYSTKRFDSEGIGNNKLLKLTIKYPTSGNYYFWSYIPQKVQIHAIKLEIGTVSTLDKDVAPNYSEELLKCQRYFQRIVNNSNVNSFLSIGLCTSQTLALMTYILPIKMRSVPTLSGKTLNVCIYHQNSSGAYIGDTVSASNITLQNANDTFLRFIFTFSSSILTKGEVIQIGLGANGYIDLSADL